MFAIVINNFHHIESISGLSKLTLNELEPALQFCSHLIYGYAGINPSSYKMVSTNEKLNVDPSFGNSNYPAITGKN